MLFYLICLLVMGVPVLTMELAVGRASKRVRFWHIKSWKNRMESGTSTVGSALRGAAF